VPQASAQLALDFHNAKRHDVAVQPLEWSPELATVAQNWANHLASTGCELQHTQHSKYGENLFGGNGMPFTALDAAKDWYSETAKFKYGVLTPANWSASGHYTQMVWNHSTHMGMGQASCKDGSIVIVAEYNPAGNYMGQAPYDARPSALATEPAK
jgi:pathogenesis-related protein 1